MYSSLTTLSGCSLVIFSPGLMSVAVILPIPPNSCTVDLCLLCSHIIKFGVVSAFSRLKTLGFHMISIVSFQRRAVMEFFPESLEFDDWFFVFLIELGCSLFASLLPLRRFGPQRFTPRMVSIAKVTVLGLGLE